MAESQRILIDSYTEFTRLLSKNEILGIINNYKISLSYEDFIIALQSQKAFEFNNCIINIDDTIGVDNTYYRNELSCKLSFQSCIFENGLFIRKLNLGGDLTFENCEFKELTILLISNMKEINNLSLIISDCTITESINLFGIDNIKTCITGEYDVISYSSITSPLKIYNKNKLRYENYTLTNNEFNVYYNIEFIQFYKCNFEVDFVINNYSGKSLKQININSCRFKSIADFKYKELDNISISDSTFNDKLLIIDSKIACLELINCSFENTVKIVNLEESISNINIERSTIKGMFLLNAFGEGRRINFTDSTSNVSFKHLFVEPTGYLIIRQITHGNFNFDYANVLGQIVMQELDIDSLQMHNASIIGSLIIQDIKLKELDLKNTSLIGKLVFNPSDTLNIFDSNIIQNRETAYLLKKGKQEEGDSISASHFKRKELSLYLNGCLSDFYLWKKDKTNELKKLYNKWLKIPSMILMCVLIPFIPFMYILAILYLSLITPILLIFNWLKVKRILDKESIVLFFNKISNDFGQSWVRGIIFTMAFAYIFYLLINFYGLEKPIFRFAWSLEGFGTAWKEYLKILNVLNFNDKLDNFKFTALGETLFFVSKVFVSYGIYQTVSAFRKFGK